MHAAEKGPHTISRGQLDTFIQFQYDDLAAKAHDPYADAKSTILINYLRGHSRLRILNVGSGSGELSLRLAALGHDVCGIDLEPAHTELARKNAARQGAPANCRFVTSAIEDFHADGLYDCLVSTDVLEHIEDDRFAFARMMELLRPGGLILIAVPAGPWLFGYHDEQLGHFRRYNKRSLRRLVEPLCEVQALRYFGFTLVPVCLLYSKWLRRPYPVRDWGDRQQSPLRSGLLRTVMNLERWLRMPLGTSLLMKGARIA
jgi:2-polyprenyl-3-methyl-5-hydroxy-6-metoxy-1,4-benzoquinol methylase